MSSRAGASWMAFGFVALLIYLNYRSKQSTDEFGRDRTRHLVPLAKRVDKDNLLKELNVPQPQDGSQKAVEELESALVDSIPAKETKEALK